MTAPVSVGTPDAELVTAARAGSAIAFELLVRRHYPAAAAVALAMMGNRMDAEDVCQDAFVRALERIEDCRDASKFAPWLMQIVRNGARNALDKRRVRDADELLDGVAEAPGSTDTDVYAGELRCRLEGALRTLSPRQREVVLLHDLEGWDHRGIAGSLGISEESSRQFLFQGRRALRSALGPHILREYTDGQGS